MPSGVFLEHYVMTNTSSAVHEIAKEKSSFLIRYLFRSLKRFYGMRACVCMSIDGEDCDDKKKHTIL